MLAVAAIALAPQVRAAPDYRIATDTEKSTDYALAGDLARWVAPPAGLRLSAMSTAGSAANLRLLRYDPNVKLAIVQGDVYQAFLDQARAGNGEAADTMRASRVVMPLADTELHYIVRADSPLEFIHDIKDARINGGVVGSGAALAAHAIYKSMFGAPVPDGNASRLSNEEALVKLITDKSVDVVVVASGQPAPLIAGMKPEAQKFIKLLKFDAAHPLAARALGSYKAAVLAAASYPNLLSAEWPTLAVPSYLVTYEYEQRETVDALARLARAMCQGLSVLQARGHAKWKSTDLALPALPEGWAYFTPAANEIKACLAKDGKPAVKGPQPCTAEQKLLGLCS